ncbi:MAG TPA: hypothetical protein VK590_05055 [Saprospiraceae bacterium]|nr:hypothetical protein [Saprospiraceae bacterium]
MEFHLDPNIQISKLKEQFNYAFPYLKIEFFSQAHEEFHVSNRKHLINNQDTPLSELSDKVPHELLILDPHMKVKEFEALMEDSFGLHIQIFRKSGHNWLATSVTDSLTLKEQNEKGMESINRPVAKEPMDYREQD